MSRIIAIANVKGGVGKTTATANLSAALAEHGHRVLAVDLDPQASLTISLGLHLSQLPRTIGDALNSSATPLALLLVHTQEQFDLAPANHDLRTVERELENGRIRIFALRSALEPARTRYDYMLLDCPANGGILTGNALAAADEVIIPFPADYLTLQAVDWLSQLVKEMQKKINPSLRVTGLFHSMCEPSLRHDYEVTAEAQQAFGIEIPFFSAVARRNEVFQIAARAGQTVIRFAPESESAEAYRALATEIERGVHEPETEDVYALLRQAQAALASLDKEGAYAAFSEATKLAPRIPEVWIGRAQSASEWDESMRSYSEALRVETRVPGGAGGARGRYKWKTRSELGSRYSNANGSGTILCRAQPCSLRLQHLPPRH